MKPIVDRRGQVIGERYTLEKAIGGGGFGAVYEARDGHLNGRAVAVKMLRADAKEHPEFVIRFRREMELIAQLQNPNIVQVIDSGETSDGELYLVMERLEGRTLRHVMSAEGRLPIHRVLAIGRQIAEALEAAHRADIVHRDIKPENIMLLGGDDSHRDFVKVLDFGISKSLSEKDGFVTEQGRVIGSPHYMSPEQLFGTPLTTASDVFVFSVVMYQLLTGRHPFDRETIGALRQAIVSEDAKPLRQTAPDLPVNDEFEAILHRGMRKDVKERTQSVREVMDNLLQQVDAPAAELAYAATAGGHPVPGRSQPRYTRWLPISLGALVIALIAFAAMRSQGLSGDKERRVETAVEAQSCQLEFEEIAAEVMGLATALRAQSPRRAAERRQRDRLASRLSGAVALLTQQGTLACKSGRTTVSEAWNERIWRIKISVQGGRALLSDKESVDRKVAADVGALVDVIVASADPKSTLEPLVTAAVKRGGGALSLSLQRRCLGTSDEGDKRCPDTLRTGQAFNLGGELSAAAHLYVLIYDDGGRFKVLEPKTSGQTARPAGPIIVAADRPLMAHPGQSILAVASAEPIPAIEALVGKLLSGKKGEMAQSARTLLARLALTAQKGSVPSQVLLRMP